MAVHTQVSQMSLLAFLENYDLPGHFETYTGIAEGVDNTNYLLKIGGVSYILTLYEARVQEKDLPFFLTLMDYAAEKGVCCPRPLGTRKGERYGFLEGRPAALFSFLEGRSCLNPDAQSCHKVGAALALFHQRMQDFSGRRPNPLAVTSLPAFLSSMGQEVDRFRAGLLPEITQELDEVQTLWPEHLPKGLIHADLFPDNVFFKNGEVSGFIDFYFSCYDLLAFDLAICLTAWCFDHLEKFDKARANALVSGYQSVRPLETEEKKTLPVLLRGACLRFFLTRLHDWLHVTPSPMIRVHDPQAYLDKLIFFKKHTSLERIGLSFS